MDWQEVFSQLNDLPPTFTRPGQTYQWWASALTEEFARYTTASDAYTAQVNFSEANGLWLDVWGRLYGIERDPNESDQAYQTRITATLQASHGPPLAIVSFLLLSLGIVSTVTEAIPAAVGWMVQLGGTAQLANLPQIAADLDFVRPAGVPYNFAVLKGGCYLTTINYLGRPRVTGAYLTLPVSRIGPDIPSSTNNATPLLPTTFLTDPTLNPSLA
jgi:hypothetical protein